jgi:hypothetical protein
MNLKRTINKTRLYYYDEETLTFEKGKWLNGLYISFLLNILIIAGLFSNNVSINLKYQNALNILRFKEKTIKHLEVKGQDSATEYADFRRSLPLKLTDAQEKRLHYLYFKYKDVINKHHCPSNLLWYISFKESGFNVNAKNSKSSASGLFQFILSTWNAMCKRGGMDISGRFNEAKQVEVMCVYLDYLFSKYGDWYLCHKEYSGNVMVYKLPYYK